MKFRFKSRQTPTLQESLMSPEHRQRIAHQAPLGHQPSGDSMAIEERRAPKIDDTQPIPPIQPSGRSMMELQLEQNRLLQEILAQNQQAGEVKARERDFPYNEQFHLIKLLIETVPPGIAVIAILAGLIVLGERNPSFQTPVVIFFTLSLVVLGIGVWSWYRWLVWVHEHFMARHDRCAMPRHMPWIFSDKEPAVETAGSRMELKRSVLDKLLGTCTLYMDTPSEGDEMFKKVRWLKKPDQLRSALGLMPRQKRFVRLRNLRDSRGV